MSLCRCVWVASDLMLLDPPPRPAPRTPRFSQYLIHTHCCGEQGLELEYTQKDGKPIARLKFDCRSLIMERTNAKELHPEPVYGWVSLYSSKPTADMILSRVPYKDLKHAEKVLKARGGFVEPSTLKQAAAAAAAAESSSEAPNPPDTAKRGSGKGKAQKVAQPTSDTEANAVAERSQSRRALAGLREGANERKAEKFKAKKALAGLKEGRNESKAETHQKRKAMAALLSVQKLELRERGPCSSSVKLAPAAA